MDITNLELLLLIDCVKNKLRSLKPSNQMEEQRQKNLIQLEIKLLVEADNRRLYL